MNNEEEEIAKTKKRTYTENNHNKISTSASHNDGGENDNICLSRLQTQQTQQQFQPISKGTSIPASPSPNPRVLTSNGCGVTNTGGIRNHNDNHGIHKQVVPVIPPKPSEYQAPPSTQLQQSQHQYQVPFHTPNPTMELSRSISRSNSIGSGNWSVTTPSMTAPLKSAQSSNSRLNDLNHCQNGKNDNYFNGVNSNGGLMDGLLDSGSYTHTDGYVGALGGGAGAKSKRNINELSQLQGMVASGVGITNSNHNSGDTHNYNGTGIDINQHKIPNHDNHNRDQFGVINNINSPGNKYGSGTLDQPPMANLNNGNVNNCNGKFTAIGNVDNYNHGHNIMGMGDNAPLLSDLGPPPAKRQKMEKSIYSELISTPIHDRTGRLIDCNKNSDQIGLPAGNINNINGVGNICTVGMQPMYTQFPVAQRGVPAQATQGTQRTQQASLGIGFTNVNSNTTTMNKENDCHTSMDSSFFAHDMSQLQGNEMSTNVDQQIGAQPTDQSQLTTQATYNCLHHLQTGTNTDVSTTRPRVGSVAAYSNNVHYGQLQAGYPQPLITSLYDYDYKYNYPTRSGGLGQSGMERGAMDFGSATAGDTQVAQVAQPGHATQATQKAIQAIQAIQSIQAMSQIGPQHPNQSQFATPRTGIRSVGAYYSNNHHDVAPQALIPTTGVTSPYNCGMESGGMDLGFAMNDYNNVNNQNNPVGNDMIGGWWICDDCGAKNVSIFPNDCGNPNCKKNRKQKNGTNNDSHLKDERKDNDGSGGGFNGSGTSHHHNGSARCDGSHGNNDNSNSNGYGARGLNGNSNNCSNYNCHDEPVAVLTLSSNFGKLSILPKLPDSNCFLDKATPKSDSKNRAYHVEKGGIRQKIGFAKPKPDHLSEHAHVQQETLQFVVTNINANGNSNSHKNNANDSNVGYVWNAGKIIQGSGRAFVRQFVNFAEKRLKLHF